MSVDWIKRCLWVALTFPLVRLVVGAVTDRLGANPIELILRNTGFWTLSCLMLTLTVTPMRRLTGFSQLVRVRRLLGLFAFDYALLHLSTYVILDQYFDWANILKDLTKRPYITLGMTALVLLVPLALTSTDGMMRRLGGGRWRRLHQLVYLIGGLGVVHFWWLVKKDVSQPFLFALVFFSLMAHRFFWRRKPSPLPSNPPS